MKKLITIVLLALGAAFAFSVPAVAASAVSFSGGQNIVTPGSATSVVPLGPLQWGTDRAGRLEICVSFKNLMATRCGKWVPPEQYVQNRYPGARYVGFGPVYYGQYTGSGRVIGILLYIKSAP